MSIKINSINQLKDSCKDSIVEYFISLGNGRLRSSKDIEYNSVNNTFEIFNHIDDTREVLTEDELNTKSNIGEAITKGALYQYDY